MDLSKYSYLLQHYETVVLTLHESHKQKAFFYKKISNILSLISIILGTITGTSSISIYNQNNTTYQLINIVLVYMITMLSSCQKMVEPSKNYERFRNASEEYLRLFYEIKYKITFELPSEETFKIYVKELNIQLEDMRIKFPFIDDKTYDQNKERTIKAKQVKSIEISIENINTNENNVY